MADGFTVEIKGLAETAKALREIPEKFARSILRDALRAGGEVIRAAAEASAAYRSNTPEHLREDIIVRVYLKQDLSGRAVIGPGYSGEGTDDPGVYGKFVEEGHKEGKHSAIAEERKHALTKAELGSSEVPAHPWLRPAFEASAEAAVAAVEAVVEVGLLAVARSYETGLVK
jgi:HK97 gp10 family phage protein